MDEKQQEIFAELQKLNFQVGRLISDFESEKDFRKMRHEDFEKRLRGLEDRFAEFHGRMIATIAIASLLWGAAVAIVLKLIK